MTHRTGSFPLMNLAEDFGVDYGDVLMCVEPWRRQRCREAWTDGVQELCDAAMARIYDVLGDVQKVDQFVDEIIAHGKRRAGVS